MSHYLYFSLLVSDGAVCRAWTVRSQGRSGRTILSDAAWEACLGHNNGGLACSNLYTRTKLHRQEKSTTAKCFIERDRRSESDSTRRDITKQSNQPTINERAIIAARTAMRIEKLDRSGVFNRLSSQLIRLNRGCSCCRNGFLLPVLVVVVVDMVVCIW